MAFDPLIKTCVVSIGKGWGALGEVAAISITMPDNNGPFVAQTIAYSGTGSTAAPAGDGTRDVLLGADNVHPTAAGSMALGQYEASAIRSILAAL